VGKFKKFGGGFKKGGGGFKKGGGGFKQGGGQMWRYNFLKIFFNLSITSYFIAL